MTEEANQDFLINEELNNDDDFKAIHVSPSESMDNPIEVIKKENNSLLENENDIAKDILKKRKSDDDSYSPKSKRNGSISREHNRRSNERHRRDSNRDLSEEIQLKVLIPSSCAGGVIGRGGEKIGQIQKDAQVKCKMSKNNEFYPNTNERVCVINGSVRGCLKAYELINDRMYEKTDKGHHMDEDRAHQIKMLIPNNTAGLLIGKGGSYIKIIKDDSGAFVQISVKTSDLAERIVTIEGSSDKRHRALKMVVEKMSQDPQHNSVTTLTYPTSASSSYDDRSTTEKNNISNSLSIGNNVTQLAGLNNLNMLIMNSGGSFQMTAESLADSLRTTGYSSQAIQEIIESITVLMKYGLITKLPPGNSLSSLAGLVGTGSSSSNKSSNNQRDSYNDNKRSNRYDRYDRSDNRSHNSSYSNNNSNSYSNSNSNNLNNVLQMLSGSLNKRY